MRLAMTCRFGSAYHGFGVTRCGERVSMCVPPCVIPHAFIRCILVYTTNTHCAHREIELGVHVQACDCLTEALRTPSLNDWPVLPAFIVPPVLPCSPTTRLAAAVMCAPRVLVRTQHTFCVQYCACIVSASALHVSVATASVRRSLRNGNHSFEACAVIFYDHAQGQVRRSRQAEAQVRESTRAAQLQA